MHWDEVGWLFFLGFFLRDITNYWYCGHLFFKEQMLLKKKEFLDSVLSVPW